MANFILVCGSGWNSEGGVNSPYDVLYHRVNNKMWPIYLNTKNRHNISVDDELLFYISGKKKCGGQVVAKAKVYELHKKDSSKIYGNLHDLEEEVSFGENILYFITLKNVEFLSKPVTLKDNLESISFNSKNPQKWGSILQGGCRSITKEDFLILSGAAPH